MVVVAGSSCWLRIIDSWLWLNCLAHSSSFLSPFTFEIKILTIYMMLECYKVQSEKFEFFSFVASHISSTWKEVCSMSVQLSTDLLRDSNKSYMS